MSFPEEADKITRLAGTLRLSLADEKQLQAQLGQALAASGIDHTPEYRLGETDRVDFFLPSGLGIECKLRGGKSSIYRQLRRYAGSPKIKALLLITNTAMGLPESISGKPVYYCSLGSAWL